MDTEKQRQCRHDNARLTESRDAWSKQLLMMPTESLLTNGECRFCQKNPWVDQKHRMPSWFLDMNIRLVWWGKHRRTTEKWCIHCNTHGKLKGSSTLCSKNYPLCYFPMLSNVACYAIDSHPLFHNIIILYKNSIKFIKFILQSSQYKFTGPSVQLYNRLPVVVLKHEWCLTIIHERMLLLIWEWVKKTLSVATKKGWTSRTCLHASDNLLCWHNSSMLKVTYYVQIIATIMWKSLYVRSNTVLILRRYDEFICMCRVTQVLLGI